MLSSERGGWEGWGGGGGHLAAARVECRGNPTPDPNPNPNPNPHPNPNPNPNLNPNPRPNLAAARVERLGDESAAAAAVGVDRAVGEHYLAVRRAKPQQPA